MNVEKKRNNCAYTWISVSDDAIHKHPRCSTVILVSWKHLLTCDYCRFRICYRWDLSEFFGSSIYPNVECSQIFKRKETNAILYFWFSFKYQFIQLCVYKMKWNAQDRFSSYVYVIFRTDFWYFVFYLSVWYLFFIYCNCILCFVSRIENWKREWNAFRFRIIHTNKFK